MRAYAREWNLDPNKIGIMGFSAGAELSAPAAVLFEDFDKKNSDPGDPLAVLTRVADDEQFELHKDGTAGRLGQSEVKLIDPDTGGDPGRLPPAKLHLLPNRTASDHLRRRLDRQLPRASPAHAARLGACRVAIFLLEISTDADRPVPPAHLRREREALEPELVADSPNQFVSIAVELANDLPRLSELRASLRQRLKQSPLMDAPRFAGSVEAAYRSMWQRWCAPRGRSTSA